MPALFVAGHDACVLHEGDGGPCPVALQAVFVIGLGIGGRRHAFVDDAVLGRNAPQAEQLLHRHKIIASGLEGVYDAAGGIQVVLGAVVEQDDVPVLDVSDDGPGHFLTGHLFSRRRVLAPQNEGRIDIVQYRLGADAEGRAHPEIFLSGDFRQPLPAPLRLEPHLSRVQTRQVQMLPGVVGDLMALLSHAAHQVLFGGHPAAHHEKRTLHPPLVQRLHHLGCPGLIGTIVKGDGHQLGGTCGNGQKLGQK